MSADFATSRSDQPAATSNAARLRVTEWRTPCDPERMADLQARNEELTDRLALMTERWLRAEEDAERLAAALALVRARSNIAEYLDAEGHLGVVHALAIHAERKAEEA